MHCHQDDLCALNHTQNIVVPNHSDLSLLLILWVDWNPWSNSVLHEALLESYTCLEHPRWPHALHNLSLDCWSLHSSLGWASQQLGCWLKKAKVFTWSRTGILDPILGSKPVTKLTWVQEEKNRPPCPDGGRSGREFGTLSSAHLRDADSLIHVWMESPLYA